MDDIERNEDGVTWIDGEPYSPLTQRERTFLDVAVKAQKERDAARQQYQGAAEALREIRERMNAEPDDDMLEDVIVIVDRVLPPEGS